jgi:hypothetical protein
VLVTPLGGGEVVEDREPDTPYMDVVDDLALLVLAVALAPTDSDADLDRSVVRELHRRRSPAIFEQSTRLAPSSDPSTRRLARDILGQLVYERGISYAVVTLPILERLCEAREEAPVLDAAIAALGHLGQPEALTPTTSQMSETGDRRAGELGPWAVSPSMPPSCSATPHSPSL